MKRESSETLVICGIDEAGRGAWAGPLVAAAVIITEEQTRKLRQSTYLKIKDSKLLNISQRQCIYIQLKQLGVVMATEIISVRRINNRGINRANRESIRTLIKRLTADQYIVDGNLKLGRIKDKTHKIKTIVDADATYLPTILAGIVAKVERDKIMKKLHRQFPRYKWCNNMGYGTKEHQEALMKYQMTYYHRSIFVTSGLQKK